VALRQGLRAKDGETNQLRRQSFVLNLGFFLQPALAKPAHDSVHLGEIEAAVMQVKQRCRQDAGGRTIYLFLAFDRAESFQQRHGDHGSFRSPALILLTPPGSGPETIFRFPRLIGGPASRFHCPTPWTGFGPREALPFQSIEFGDRRHAG
jgi:hypothetical protein